MTKENLYLGRTGEEAAVDLLQENGYNIIARNYRTRLGEIDIIAYQKDTLCFIEVKTRSSGRFGLPQEALSKPKQRQIAKAALIFIKEKGLFNKKARFDVVSVIAWPKPAKINLIKGAFELDPSFSP
ncbi:MAG: YraN family protein [Candidatus Omnitrophica bacterium]|nr:YraN family protein [Candidatus Omnitrophota bacterium]MBL7210257.1 YraN family protein [Candidatus Omnitrophota bacterium]